MCRIFAVLLIAFVVAMPPAHAGDAGSTRDLARDCQTLLRGKKGTGNKIQIPFTERALVCWGYMQAMQDFAVLGDADGRRLLGACPPEKTTLIELIEVFVGYVRTHEDDLPENAALAMTRALQQAFPCTQRRSRNSKL